MLYCSHLLQYSYIAGYEDSCLDSAENECNQTYDDVTLYSNRCSYPDLVQHLAREIFYTSIIFANIFYMTINYYLLTMQLNSMNMYVENR